MIPAASPLCPTLQDEVFLRRALELAQDNVERGDGGPFGAVIVKDGQIIAEGWNRVILDKDPSAHAEIVAIRAACQLLRHYHLEKCTLYASSEPCPMCMAAVYWAKVERVVFANSRDRAASIGFCDEELYCQLTLPPEHRQIPALHLPLTGAERPLQSWLCSSTKTRY